MNKKLLQKYFRNQCTLEEIEEVLDWFQTEEGEEYLENRLNQDMKRYSEDENLLLHPGFQSDKVLQNIEKKRNKRVYQNRSRDRWWVRVAVILIICGVFAGGGYWSLQSTGLLEQAVYLEEEETEVELRSISTGDSQQRLVTLGDDTQIRLNENSKIVVPEVFSSDSRHVQLTGEAYFIIARDENRPFTLQTDQAFIRVLGTEFNVKVDQSSRQVQVAVAEGRVSLRTDGDESGREVILTEDTFALLHMDDDDILIERSPVSNYVSWMTGDLIFHDESLLIVSRYLERIYGVSFRFNEQELKYLTLSANIVMRDLEEVLDIISETLEINYLYEDDTILWGKGR